MDEKLIARMRSIKRADKRPDLASPRTLYDLLKRGAKVFLVFDNNAQRIKYQQRLIKEAAAFLDQEPVGGTPTASLAGQRVFSWANGAELALATDVPGDPKGKLFGEALPADAKQVRLSVPPDWN